MKTKEIQKANFLGKLPDMTLLMLMVFSFGGIFGFIYEELFYRIDLGYFVKRGTTFGPWIPIYGFGAVLILLTANRFRHRPATVFLVSAAVCGLLEYITGLVLLRMGGIRLWDYNTEIWNWGNLGGFVCARSVVFFGFSALLLLYVVCPLLLRLRKTIGTPAFRAIAVGSACLFAFDILISLLIRTGG